MFPRHSNASIVAPVPDGHLAVGFKSGAGENLSSLLGPGVVVGCFGWTEIVVVELSVDGGGQRISPVLHG